MSLLDVLNGNTGVSVGGLGGTQKRRVYDYEPQDTPSPTPASWTGGGSEPAANSRERGAPERFDLNKYFSDSTGNTDVANAMAAVGETPGFVYERPLAIASALTGSPIIDESGKSFVGDIPILGDLVGGLGDVIKNVQMAPSALVNMGTMKGLAQGYREGWTDDAIMPGDIVLTHAGQEKMTWGQYKREAAAKGFTSQDVEDYLDGKKQLYDFGEKAMFADPMFNLAATMVTDPFNLVFAAGPALKLVQGAGLVGKMVESGAISSRALSVTEAAVKAGIGKDSTWLGIAKYFEGVGRGASMVPGGSQAVGALAATGRATVRGAKLYQKAALGASAGQVGLLAADNVTKNGPISGFLEPLFELNQAAFDNRPLSRNMAFAIFSASTFPLHTYIGGLNQARRTAMFKAQGGWKGVERDLLKSLGEGWDATPAQVLERFGGVGEFRNFVYHISANIAFDKIYANPKLKAALSHYDSLQEAAMKNRYLADLITENVQEMFAKRKISGKDLDRRMRDWFANREGINNRVEFPWHGKEAIDRWHEYASVAAPVSNVFFNQAEAIIGLADTLPSEALTGMQSAIRTVATDGAVHIDDLRSWLSRYPQLVKKGEGPWVEYLLREHDGKTVPLKDIDRLLRREIKNAPTIRELTSEFASREAGPAREWRSGEATNGVEPSALAQKALDPETRPGAMAVSRMRPSIAKRLGLRDESVADVMRSRRDADIVAFEEGIGPEMAAAGFDVDTVTNSLGSWERHMEPSVEMSINGNNLYEMRLAAATSAAAGVQDAVALSVSGSRLRSMGLKPNGYEIIVKLPDVSVDALQGVVARLSKEFDGFTINDTTGTVRVLLKDADLNPELLAKLTRSLEEIEGLYPKGAILGESSVSHSIHPAYVEFIGKSKRGGFIDATYQEVFRDARANGDPRANAHRSIAQTLAKRGADARNARSPMGSRAAVGRQAGPDGGLEGGPALTPEGLDPTRATADPAFAYHATPVENLVLIAEDKLRPQSPSGKRLSWDNGGNGKRVYFSDDPVSAATSVGIDRGFALADGQVAVLRVQRSRLHGLKGENTGLDGDPFYSNRAIGSSHVEVWYEGRWHNLDGFMEEPLPEGAAARVADVGPVYDRVADAPPGSLMWDEGRPDIVRASDGEVYFAFRSRPGETPRLKRVVEPKLLDDGQYINELGEQMSNYGPDRVEQAAKNVAEATETYNAWVGRARDVTGTVRDAGDGGLAFEGRTPQPALNPYTRPQLEADLQAAFNLTAEQASDTASIMDAYASAWASKTGRAVEDFWDTRLAGIVYGGKPGMLLQIQALERQMKGLQGPALKAAVDNAPEPQVLVDNGLGGSSPVEWVPDESGLNAGGEIGIPGGLGGLEDGSTWSLWDVWRLQSQGLDPNLMNPGLRTKIYDKLFRTLERGQEDPLDIFNRQIFALTSPQNNLTQNQAAVAALRVRDMADLQEYAGIARQVRETMPDAGPRDLANAVGLEMEKIRPGYKAGVMISKEQLGYIALNAEKMAENPEWFKLAAGESHIAYAERVGSVLYGSKMKVGNFGPMLGMPKTWELGTIDSHMVELLDDAGLIPAEVRSRVIAETRTGRSGIAPAPQEVFYRARPSEAKKYGIKVGDLNPEVPAHLRNLPWDPPSGKVIVFGGDYKVLADALEKLSEQRGFRAGGNQWVQWDMQRNRFEGHLASYPGAYKLPHMDYQALVDARNAHRAVDYMTRPPAPVGGMNPTEAFFYQRSPRNATRSARARGITKSYGNIKNWESAQWKAQEAQELADFLSKADADHAAAHQILLDELDAAKVAGETAKVEGLQQHLDTFYQGSSTAKGSIPSDALPTYDNLRHLAEQTRREAGYARADIRRFVESGQEPPEAMLANAARLEARAATALNDVRTFADSFNQRVRKGAYPELRYADPPEGVAKAEPVLRKADLLPEEEAAYRDYRNTSADDLCTAIGFSGKVGEFMGCQHPAGHQGTHVWVHAPGTSIAAERWSVSATWDQYRSFMAERGIRLQDELLDAPKGSTQFLDDGRALVRGFESADFSTGIHEFAHVVLPDVLGDAADGAAARAWLGLKDGQAVTTAAHEKFARGFEKYVREGKAPTPELEGVFARARSFLVDIYRRLRGSPIDVKITKEMRGVFERMFQEVDPAQAGRFDPNPGPMSMALRHAEDARGWKLTDSRAAEVRGEVAQLGAKKKLTPEEAARFDQLSTSLDRHIIASGEAAKGRVLYMAERDATVSSQIPLHRSLDGLPEASRADLAVLNARLRELNPTYELKHPPKMAHFYKENQGNLIADYFETRDHVAEVLSTWGGVGRITRFLDWLTAPMENSRLGNASRQALYNQLLPKGAKVAEVDAFIKALAQEAKLHTIGPMEVRAFRNGTALTAQTINKIAAGDKLAGRAPIFSEKAIAAIGQDNFAKYLDQASNRFIRWAQDTRVQPGKPGAFAAMVDDVYTGFQKTKAGDVSRLVSKTMYHVLRFLSDPRWWAMNVLEADMIGGLRYGTSATRLKGAQSAVPERPFLAHELGRETAAGMSTATITEALGDAQNGWLYTRRLGGYGSRAFDHERPQSVIAFLREIEGTDTYRGLEDLARRANDVRDTSPMFVEDIVDGLDKYLYDFDTKGTKATVWDEAKSIFDDTVLFEGDPARGIPPMAPVVQRIWEANDGVWNDIQKVFHGNPSRSTLERMGNSYWMFWPLSYQLKAGKWLWDVMTNKFGGRPTGMTTAAMWNHYYQRHKETMANDPSYAAMFEDHPTAWFVAQMLFPITPVDLGVSLSRPLRFAGGKLGLWGDYKSASDPVTAAGAILSFGPTYTAELMARLGRDLFKEPTNNLFPAPGQDVVSGASTNLVMAP